MNLCINSRILSGSLSGLQRYLLSILKGFDQETYGYRLFAPAKPLKIVQSHLWEQFLLPRQLGPLGKKGLLWSPANSGPVSYHNQVVTIHDLLHLDRPDLHANSFLAPQLYRWMLPRLLRKVKGIIAISQYTKERIMSLLSVPEEKIQVIYRTVDDQFSPASAGDVKRVRNKYNIKWERYVLSLGSLEPKKNLKTLLGGWKRLLPLLKDDVGLVLAGKQHSRLSLKDLGLDTLPRNVMFTGFVDDEDLPALYSGASVFVFPSLYEGFGLPPLEAMACGTPVVVSNATSLPEVCGNAALYANPLDVDDVAEKIEAVLKDSALAGKMQEKGLARAVQFSWKKCVEEHIAFFEKLM